MGIYKKPSKAKMYEAIQLAKRLKREWKDVAYRHIPRNLNTVPDDMARRALSA